MQEPDSIFCTDPPGENYENNLMSHFMAES